MPESSKPLRLWTVRGTATVSVYMKVEARTKAEALRKAERGDELWECDEVDGDVTIDKELTTDVR